MRNSKFGFLFVLAPALVFPNLSFADEQCAYTTRDGQITVVPSKDQIPAQFRAQSRCFSANEKLAAPDEIVLDGTVRHEDMSSPVGRIKLQWPRKIESLFGRTPLRAMADAARTVSRAISQGSFPSQLQDLNLEWKVVFLDEDLPETQIPTYLVTNCHPGWMTPPANVYIVGQRVAGGCGGASVSRGVADSQLTEVLLHEMGHAIEYQLLKGAEFSQDRMRAEGFATWFERYAANYSSILNQRELVSRFRKVAGESIRRSPNVFQFQGSYEDYARASMFFDAIAERRGLASLFDVYREMTKSGKTFFQAVSAKLDWNEERLNSEVLKLVQSNR